MATIAELKKRFEVKSGKVDPLFAIILGTRGSGKSTVIGTLGKPTLYIYVQEESHGKKSAGIFGKDNITSICLNTDPATGVLTSTPEKNPDRVLTDLIAVLDTPELEKEFGAIALDGFSSLDRYIYSGAEVQKASKYDQTKVTMAVYDRVISRLKILQSKGLDVVVTCASEGVLDAEGGFVSLTPKLRGTGVVDGVIGQFDIVCVVGVVQVSNDSAGEPESKFAFQFRPTVSREGKKVTGQTFAVTFKPRIAGVPQESIPSLMVADFKKIRELMSKAAG